MSEQTVIVKSKLRYLMLDHGIKSIKKLGEQTGLNEITLTDFADNKSKQIRFETLITLKKHFNLKSISELMEFEE